MKREQQEKFVRNLLKFTAPGIGVFFGQLALGADVRIAATTGLLVIYGVLSDYFSKMK